MFLLFVLASYTSFKENVQVLDVLVVVDPPYCCPSPPFNTLLQECITKIYTCFHVVI